MGLKDFCKSFVTSEEDEDGVYVDFSDEEVESLTNYENNKGATKMSGEAKMVLFEPRKFDDVSVIANALKERKAVVVNVHRLGSDAAQRTIDFLTGVITALDGDIQMIEANVALCTPSTISVDGKITLGPDAE